MAQSRHDRIGWRQVAAGYVVCLCTAAALAAALWAKTFPVIESAIGGVVILATLLATWLEPHARHIQLRALAERPHLDLQLKRAAVTLLCLVSLATTAGVVVWRLAAFS